MGTPHMYMDVHTQWDRTSTLPPPLTSEQATASSLASAPLSVKQGCLL